MTSGLCLNYTGVFSQQSRFTFVKKVKIETAKKIGIIHDLFKTYAKISHYILNTK